MNYKDIIILVTSAGGPAGIGMTRCLEDFTVYGDDDSEWGRKLMEAPQWNGEEYDLRIPVHSQLILSALKAKTFLPPQEEIELCWDKAKCAKILGNLAPKTHWVRDTMGSGGKGAQMASEYLPGKNYACEMVWYNGELKGWFQKERISYKSSSISHEVTGSAMIAKCINYPLLLDISKRAINMISNNPHGIYSVDLKENELGEPKITEINAGRFVTSSYIFYYHGYNLPKLMVELALNLLVSPLGEYPENKLVIRQVDRLPYYGF